MKKKSDEEERGQELNWLARANDEVRRGLLTAGGDHNVSIRMSESIKELCEVIEVVKALVQFDEFSTVDDDHKIGRFYVPTRAESGEYLIFYIVYEDLARTRYFDRRVEKGRVCPGYKGCYGRGPRGA